MPMEKDRHEEILQSLLDPSLEQSQRTELLQELRADYSTVLGDFKDFTEKTEKLQKDNDDLVVSNSMLFRKVGTQGDPDLEKKEEQKSFSEEITLEALEAE